MEIVIDSPNVSRNEITYKIHVSRPLRKYFINDTFYVQYDINMDVSSVDKSILVIPVAALTAPIAWAVGADIRLNEIDETYMRSLDKVKDAYRILHSDFSFSGDITTGETVRNEFGGDRAGMLFTGGVDSLTSYLRNRQRRPDLFSVWGLPDIPPYNAEFADIMWTSINRFADLDSLEVIHVKTDMVYNINRELLSKEFGLGWFSDAAFGVFLLGLCAPATAIKGINTVIIASSWTTDYKGPPGSHPLIDNSVSWADVSVIHDGHELSRHQKVHYLCRQENLRYLPYLRVCWEWVVSHNCGNCEKCFRTIAGLAAEGVDPNNCNFKIDNRTFLYIMDCFHKGRITLDEMDICLWSDIQNHIPERIATDISGSREFLTWLKAYDLSKHRGNRLHKSIWGIHRLFLNRRLKARSVWRRMRCYYYIVLSKLKLI
jgi:hypothetical protein